MVTEWRQRARAEVAEAIAGVQEEGLGTGQGGGAGGSRDIMGCHQSHNMHLKRQRGDWEGSERDWNY